MVELTITDHPKTRQDAVDVIKDLPKGKKWLVKIFPWTQKKTTAQNRLLWKWNTEIGEYWGWESEEAHNFFKERFLLNILYRDDPGFARMADAIRNVKQYSKDDHDFIRKQVIDLVSTTKLDAKQMSEYLTKIRRFAHENNIGITIPPDKEMVFLCGISEKEAS